MNTLNRILVITGDLLLLGVGGVILLVTVELIEPQGLVSPPWDQGLAPFTQLDPAMWWSVVGICLGLGLVGILLLVLELRGPPHQAATLLLKQDDLGRVTAAITSIHDLVSRETGYMDGVMESSTDVKESPEGIHLHCRLSVDPAANVSELGQQAQKRIRGSVEHYLGKPVAGVHIQAQIAPLEKNKKKRGSRVR